MQGIRRLFTLHKPSRRLIIKTSLYTDYSYPYQNTNCIVSVVNGQITATYLKLENLDKIEDILHLDSYLDTFPESLNTISLGNPDLNKLYMNLSVKQLYRRQNEFLIYDLADKSAVECLKEINLLTGRKIWKF
jgi:hypothetical protein